MDSKLDAIFRAGFQPAQQTDTRQDIRREDVHNDQQRKNRSNRHDPQTDEEDRATLSLLALHDFLKDLLIQAGEPAPFHIAQTLPPEEHEPVQPSPQSLASASAAKAYQTTARVVPGQSVDFSERHEGATSHQPISLSAEDLRLIHALIGDVEALGQRGITAIPLYPAETFLQTLTLSVREAASL